MSAVYFRYTPIYGFKPIMIILGTYYVGYHFEKWNDARIKKAKERDADILLNWSFNNPAKVLTREEWKWNSRVRPVGTYDLWAMQAENKLERIQNLSKGPERIKRWVRNIIEFTGIYSKTELEDINHPMGYYLRPRDFSMPILPRWRRSDYLLTSDLARQLMATGEGHQPKYEPDDILYGPGGPGFRTLINNLNAIHAIDSPINIRRKLALAQQSTSESKQEKE